MDSEQMTRAFLSAPLTCSGCCHRSAALLPAVAQGCCISMFSADLLVCEMPPLPPEVTLLVSADLKCFWERVGTLRGAWWIFTQPKAKVGSNTVTAYFPPR